MPAASQRDKPEDVSVYAVVVALQRLPEDAAQNPVFGFTESPVANLVFRLAGANRMSDVFLFHMNGSAGAAQRLGAASSLFEVTASRRHRSRRRLAEVPEARTARERPRLWLRLQLVGRPLFPLC